MKIELKNIYVSEQLSKETNAFTAAVYINDKQVGTAENDGGGGQTFIRPSGREGSALIGEAEKWCKTLPPYVHENLIINGKPAKTSMTLELFIDNIVDEYIRQKELAKFQRRMEKYMLNGILFGIPDKEFKQLRFTTPINQIINSTAGLKALKVSIYEKILPILKEGEKILNTNIPPETINALGIPLDKMVERKAPGNAIMEQTNKQTKKKYRVKKSR